MATTPVQISKLKNYLQGYPDQHGAAQILQGFSEGFKLCYSGPRHATNCPNLKSLVGLEEQASHLINKEIFLGRVAGPFPRPPLPNLRLSPVGLVPKKDGSFRLIHHLSYPSGSSVNDFIDSELCSVNYTSFEVALEMLAKLGNGALVARLDIKSAFRLLPIHPSDFDLLGFQIQGKVYIDMCLPFGCAISCAKFEQFSTFLEWALRVKSGSSNVVHYLDDFLLAGRSETMECQNLMSCFCSICTDLGVPLAQDKTVGPTSVLTFLGLEIDTIHMTVKIPYDKLNQLKSELIFILTKNKVTLSQLQKLTGLLNFCVRAIPSGRAFVRRLYDATRGLTKPHHRRRVTIEMKKDIHTWLLFLDFFNGVTSYQLVNWTTDFDLHLFTDSAGCPDLGCGAVFVSHWAYMLWPQEWKNSSIFKQVTFLELVPIVMAFTIWANQFQGKKIILHTDNKALVSILNSKTSKSKQIMHLLRPLVLQGLLHNILFKGVHIEGIKNVKADSLSRQQWSKFRESFPEADKHPTEVPITFRQQISSIDLEHC